MQERLEGSSVCRCSVCWNPEWVQVVHSEGSMLWELSSEYAKALGHMPTV